MNTKVTSFRFPADTVSNLEKLTSVYGMNKTDILIQLINNEVKALDGNKELLAAVEKLRAMNDILNGIKTSIDPQKG